MFVLFASLILTGCCVYAARTMALGLGRSRKVWMWAAALLGPLPLPLLALVPKRGL